jgi:NAD(P) transhydrogenase subunit alpha
MGADAEADSGQIGKQRPVTVGVPREIAEGERRVALVPQVVGRLRSRGLTVVVEPGAGLGALIPDEAYTAAGAVLGDPWTTDVVLTVTPPTSEQVPRLRPGTVLIGFLAPLTAPGTVADLRAAGVHGFAMEAVPRISRAQSMDALSSR